MTLLGVPLTFDAGTLLFPLSYIFGDILTEVYGYQQSRRVIWTGFAAAALMSVTFWVIRQLPGEATWQGYAGDAAYDAILGGVSSGGIIIASLAAYLVGEFSNSFVLAKIEDCHAGPLFVGAHHRQHAGRGGRGFDRVCDRRQSLRRLPVGDRA